MTDPAMDIAKYLSANSGGWWDGLQLTSESSPETSNLFVHDLPNSPDFAIVVHRYEGRPPDETFGNPLLVRNPRIQVMVRHKQSNIALDRAEEVLRYLVQVKDQVLNGTKYQRIKAVGEPFEIGPDPTNRQRAVANFEASFYDSV